MELTLFTRDPMPEAERGTLEYAASAAACRRVVRIEMTMEEAQNLSVGLNVADTHGVPTKFLKPLSDLEQLLCVNLPPPGAK